MKTRTLSLAAFALLACTAASAKPLGFLAMRVYVPAGGDIRQVALPTLHFEYTDGTVKEVPPCADPRGITSEYLRLVAEQQPACGWSIALNANRFPDPNVALPDTAATYWVTPFLPEASLKQILIRGTFPNARYFSFNSYDATGSSFEVNGVKSSLPDYRMTPDSGDQNPWQQPALAGGHYTVRVVRDPGAATQNALLMPPAQEGGPLDLVLNMPTIRNCNPTCFDTHFFRPAKSMISSSFPNSDSAYVISLVKPQPGTVMVIRGKLPTFTRDDTPSPWPSGKQLRYASVCNNLLIKPYPVVENGCLKDSELKLDARGYYTVVVSHVRPVFRDHNWLPFSTLLPLQEHVVVLRNMISDAGFAQSALNVPQDNQWTSASRVMGAYYPTIKRCTRTDYALKGADCTAIE